MAKKSPPTDSEDVPTSLPDDAAIAARAICDCLGCGEVEARARVARNPDLAAAIAQLERQGDRRRIIELLYK